jgi:hypothetical protein
MSNMIINRNNPPNINNQNLSILVNTSASKLLNYENLNYEYEENDSLNYESLENYRRIDPAKIGEDIDIYENVQVSEYNKYKTKSINVGIDWLNRNVFNKKKNGIILHPKDGYELQEIIRLYLTDTDWFHFYIIKSVKTWIKILRNRALKYNRLLYSSSRIHQLKYPEILTLPIHTLKNMPMWEKGWFKNGLVNINTRTLFYVVFPNGKREYFVKIYCHDDNYIHIHIVPLFYIL